MVSHIFTQLGRLHPQFNSQKIRDDPFVLDCDNTPGFEATASLFATQVPLSSPMSSYLDLATGTGLTAVATTKSLINAGYDFRLFVADGYEHFLIKAREKLMVEFPGRSWSGYSASFLYSDVFSTIETLQLHLLKAYSLRGMSVITTQRVFLNPKKDRRAELLYY